MSSCAITISRHLKSMEKSRSLEVMLKAQMTNFIAETFLSKVKSVNERSTLLSLIDEFRQLLQNDHLNAVDYCAILQAFLSQLKTSIFGQLTEQEFLSVFGCALSVKYAQSTLSILIHSIGVGDFYKFSKTISLLDFLMGNALCEILLSVYVDNTVDSSFEEQFAQDICSFPDRVYNFLGSSVSSREAVSVGDGIIRKFESQLLHGIQSAFRSFESLNINVCSQIVISYCMASDEFARKLLSWISDDISSSTSNKFNWASVFLNSEVDVRRQEQIVIKLVHLISSGEKLNKIFGDSPVYDLHVKRIFVKKLLVERLSQLHLGSKERVSLKIADYFACIDDCLVIETLLQLLHVFSDQSQFLESVNFAQQLQLCTAILDFTNKIKEENYDKMRQKVMMFLASAVPEYLQMGDNTRRQMGMFLAETLANRFGCTKDGLHFDYSQDWILAELKSIAAGEVIEQRNSQRESTDESNSPATTKKLDCLDPRLIVLLDSDDDEEGCDQPEPPEENFSYLRQCLDFLNSKESYVNFERALRALPRLIEHKSAGEPDIAQELLDRMICLEDRFRMPEFSELRTEVTSLLFVNHPELIAGAIRVLFSNQCCMSNRYFILACIETAAHRLSVSRTLTEPLSDFNASIEKKKELGTVVWKKSKIKQPDLCKNAFLSVCNLFIYPLMDLKWEGVHLDLYEKDHILLGKILVTIGKLVIYAKFAPSHIRIVGSLFALLYRLRSNRHGFVFNGVLFCYASIAESLEIQDVFTAELQDCMEWVSEVSEERVSIDPNIIPLVQTTLRNITTVLRCE